MTAFDAVALRCNHCSAVRVDEETDDVERMRRSAADDGWSQVPGYADTEDLCSSCSHRLPGPNGARIPGGCDTCDAYKTVAPPVQGVRVVTVYHDAGCPDHAVERDEANGRRCAG